MDKREIETVLINTEELCVFTRLGKSKAVAFGDECGARVKVGDRNLWSVQKIKEHVAELAGRT